MINLPADFADYTRKLLGEKEYELLVEALGKDAPISVRLHPRKWKWSSPKDTVCVPWATDGWYLNERPSFTFDPLFHGGCYYVQEASSMFVEQVLRTYVTAPCVMLDLCAAPGGKSTHVCSVLPEGSLLVANEVIHSRTQILAENLIKWGYPGVVVTQNDPSDFMPLQNMFDVILADVPCSGEGMFRKDTASINEWSLENVEICYQRQRRIVSDVWACLKPGGLFIYSTCTYNASEDEDNVNWMIEELGAEPLEVSVEEEWGIKGDLRDSQNGALPVYHFLPSHTRGEGFFLAALRKPTGDSSDKEQAFQVKSESLSVSAPKPDKKRKAAKGGANKAIPVPAVCTNWLNNSLDFLFETKDTVLLAFPKNRYSYLSLLSKYLKVVHAGISVAEIKGKDWIPNHSLAMSCELCEDAFPKVELLYADAIAYLRREAVVLDSSIPRGIVLLTYKQAPLGFVKNIGNRANNLYPQEWRIRSGHVPDGIKGVLEGEL